MSETWNAPVVELPSAKGPITSVLVLTRSDGPTTDPRIQHLRGTSPGGRRIEGGHGRRTG